MLARPFLIINGNGETLKVRPGAGFGFSAPLSGNQMPEVFLCSLIPQKYTSKRATAATAAVSFHREKYVAAGGPDGGDGGRGGNVVFVADSNLSTLMDFRYKRKYAAQNGRGRQSQARCSGKNAAGPDHPRCPGARWCATRRADLVIADISGDEPVVVARGGRGRLGQQCILPRRPARSPKFAKPGGKGEELDGASGAEADCGRGPGGLSECGQKPPSFLSSARPSRKIANYHFTTFQPGAGCGASVGPEAQLFRGGGHPGSDRRRRPTAWAWGTISCGMWTAAGCCCMWWTCPAARAGTPWTISKRSIPSCKAFNAGAGRSGPRSCWATSATLASREQIAEFRCVRGGKGAGRSCRSARLRGRGWTQLPGAGL